MSELAKALAQNAKKRVDWEDSFAPQNLWFNPSPLAEALKSAVTPEAVAEFGLSMAPGSGEAMSARDAWDASGRGAEALGKGEWGNAASEYGNLATALMGAIPGAGVVARGTKRGAAWMDRNLPTGVNKLLDSMMPSDPANTMNIFAGPTAKQSQATKGPEAESFLKGLSGDGVVKSPFPLVSSGDVMDLTAKSKPMFRAGKGTEVELPLSSLRGTQDIINTKAVNDYMSGSSKNSLPPLPGDLSTGSPKVVKYGGEYIITDGHHRLAAEYAKGAEKAKVSFIDLDE
jgi:hypothetical protein